MRRPILASALALACALASAHARADDAPDVDIRGPIRVGSGWSTMYGARVLSLSFEDELKVKRLSDTLTVHVVFGMDGVRGPAFVNAAGETKHKGFLGVDVGPGFMWRVGPRGPAFIVNGTIGPLWEANSDDFAPHGIGVAGRAEIFPFYQDLVEVVMCPRGWVPTYVLSGIHAWALARQALARQRRGRDVRRRSRRRARAQLAHADPRRGDGRIVLGEDEAASSTRVNAHRTR
jgi:hypothetical protein